MKRSKKALLCLFLLLCITVIPVLMPMSVSALEDPGVSNTQAVYLYNIENKKAVYALNADEKVYPTSTVKLMTGIVVLENLKDRLDETVTVTEQMLSEVSGNKIKLKVGERVLVRDMLGALLVYGANDAAYVLAYTVSESLEDFVMLMNQKANEIGAYSTHYTNPTGMHDDEMFTTAKDTALISLYAYELEQFMDFAGLLKYTLPETNLSKSQTVYSRNCLLSQYYETDYYYKKARGMNAGSTVEGGYSVVTTATDGNLTYLCVVLGAQSVDGTIYSYVNATNLLEWAFDSFLYLDVLAPEQIMCDIPVTLSTSVDHVTLVARDSLSVYLPADTDIEKEITFSWTTDAEKLQAPVTKGETVGRITVLYKGEPIGSSDLITTMDIERSDMLYTFEKISEFTKSPFFIATIVSAVIFSIAYVFGKAVFLKKRSKRKYR
ncbi:MAG: D-alanyl-D-alanine carboxypeptidase [Ruminococcaceae bacterium]|nr:D-alanyl-D-alanine carboxypeptidase [Oscillospiraceae bacterium]